MLDSRPLLPVFCDVQSDDIGVVGVRDAIKRVKDDLADVVGVRLQRPLALLLDALGKRLVGVDVDRHRPIDRLA